jgi:flagellar hook-basal body complex protein FliE
MSIERTQMLSPMLSPPVGHIGTEHRAPAPTDEGKSVGPGSFVETLGNALQKVDNMQMDADAQAEKVALGGGNLHEMSLALEKADVSMRLAMKVRNKLIDAYQEIMRMNV